MLIQTTTSQDIVQDVTLFTCLCTCHPSLINPLFIQQKFIGCKIPTGFCSNHHGPNVHFLSKTKMSKADSGFIKNVFKRTLAKFSGIYVHRMSYPG